MDQVSTKLQQCFSRVFSGLSPEQMQQASVDSVKNWDSMASITLLSLVSEEFGIEMDVDHFDEFTSYQGILAYLRQHAN